MSALGCGLATFGTDQPVLVVPLRRAYWLLSGNAMWEGGVIHKARTGQDRCVWPPGQGEGLGRRTVLKKRSSVETAVTAVGGLLGVLIPG